MPAVAQPRPRPWRPLEVKTTPTVAPALARPRVCRRRGLGASEASMGEALGHTTAEGARRLPTGTRWAEAPCTASRHPRRTCSAARGSDSCTSRSYAVSYMTHCMPTTPGRTARARRRSSLSICASSLKGVRFSPESPEGSSAPAVLNFVVTASSRGASALATSVLCGGRAAAAETAGETVVRGVGEVVPAGIAPGEAAAVCVAEGRRRLAALIGGPPLPSRQPHRSTRAVPLPRADGARKARAAEGGASLTERRDRCTEPTPPRQLNPRI